MITDCSRIGAAGLVVAFVSCVSISGVVAKSVAKKRAEPTSVAMQSHLGSYVAGRMARGLNDTALAVGFYRRALRRSPDNIRIIERAFLMEATEGNWARATRRAEQLLVSRPNHRLARLWLGVVAFKAKRYVTADGHFRRAARGPIGELTTALSRAWIEVARKRGRRAYRPLKDYKQVDWSRQYIAYHLALIADMLGQRKAAGRSFQKLFAADPRTPRFAVAYLRHTLQAKQYKLARDIISTHVQQSLSGGHASVLALQPNVERKVATRLMVSDVGHGLAEVFYGLGEALTSEDGIGLGTIYLQIALALRPDFPFAQAALANVYERTKRFARANQVYDTIRPKSALEVSISIRKAYNLNAMDDTDNAKVVLDRLIAARPADIMPLDAIGTILRGRKRYREAIGYYSRLLKLLPDQRKLYWGYWYARGTCYERIKDWPNAEKDLLKSLELDPDQALTLNYLGYSWVDQKINLERGLKMIEKAVSLKPDDGYIIDSLGWAHYRLGDFTKAVKYLERAVVLRPEDPILNDHLGDALWQVGRKLEARYQWEQALTLKPEKNDEIKIRKKLIAGLEPHDGVKAVNGNKKNVAPTKSLGKRADNRSGSQRPVR